jgi:hypothetical protein
MEKFERDILDKVMERKNAILKSFVQNISKGGLGSRELGHKTSEKQKLIERLRKLSLQLNNASEGRKKEISKEIETLKNRLKSKFNHLI